jgi:hypothetical protein
MNLCWQTTATGRAAQPSALQAVVDELGGAPTVAALQEVSGGSLARFEAAGWNVLASTRAPRGRLGVAVVGRDVDAASEPHQQDAAWFTNSDVYPELAEWFVERSVAVDVAVNGSTFRYGSFHATPGSSKGPGKKGVGGRRKPWFHRRVAEWINTWPRPYAFAIDANSPKAETYDSVRYFLARGDRCEAGEDDLLGVRHLGNPPLHAADDLLRTWLSAQEPRLGDGPLAISHYTRGGKAKRFDHIWATREFVPTAVRYVPIAFPAEKHAPSDHAIVATSVELLAVDGADSPR